MGEIEAWDQETKKKELIEILYVEENVEISADIVYIYYSTSRRLLVDLIIMTDKITSSCS